ncbi:endoribonuclease LACTB2-like [Homarus americanus]|uniref:endoribonuclease LACTB2-like n=1 Tax=Homarus americanus TaxID=6706 RepID=UPI001C44A180|nr:endoribonuclease LACTB2-like [Homarus americanus]
MGVVVGGYWLNTAISKFYQGMLNINSGSLDTLWCNGQCLHWVNPPLFFQLILDLQPKVLYPGHGPLIDDPVPRIQHYIDHRNERERQILKVLSDNPKKNMTSMELVKIIYKDVPGHLHLAAEGNVNHHLQKLFKDHLVHRQEGSWCLNNMKNRL